MFSAANYARNNLVISLYLKMAACERFVERACVTGEDCYDALVELQQAELGLRLLAYAAGRN